MWASWHIFMAPTEALRGHAPRSPSMALRLLSFCFAISSMLYAFLLQSSNVSCVTACFFPVFGCFGCLEASKIPHTATIEIDFFFWQPWKGKLVFNGFWFIMIVASSDTSLYSQPLGRYPLKIVIVWYGLFVCAPCFVATCSDELEILYNFYVWGLQCRSLSWQCVGPEFYGRLQWIVGRGKNTTPKWKRCTWHLSSDFRLFSFACCEMVVDLLQE